jgi:uncharacterized protein YndB with AHSA1/START domain
MTSVFSEVDITRPIAEVYDYVTTPGNWPRWHPSSIAVSGATDHSLALGEQVAEEFRVAGQHGHCVWTVTECAAPHRWVITTIVEGANTGGAVAYALTSTAAGTHFERTFSYEAPANAPTLPAALQLATQQMVEAESAAAVRRLKAVLEGTED